MQLIKRSFLKAASVPSSPRRTKVFVSGIQPTGPPHIGNYLGFIKSWLRIQEEHPNDTKMLSIADLHSITLGFQKPEQFRKTILESVASLIAAGVDPQKTVLFQQSAVAEHTALAWIFAGLTNVTTLQSLTQYKDKAKGMSVRLGPRLALLSYPLLQAADVLIYKGTDVPVGYDQTQHLEQAADIARRFNYTFNCEYFEIPMIHPSISARVRSLRDPTKKMSKSDRSETSRILLSDSKEAIYLKCKGAFTDADAHLVPISFYPEKRPGVSNLVLLQSYFSQLPVDEVVLSCQGMGIQSFKEQLSATIEEAVAPIRTAFTELMNDEHRLGEVIRLGNQRAREKAAKNLEEIKKIIGFA